MHRITLSRLLAGVRRVIQMSGARPRGRRRFSAAEWLEPRCLLTIDLLSVAGGASAATGNSEDPQLSRNSQYVAFQSDADDLDLAVGTDGNGVQDIFVRNLLDDTTTLISRTRTGSSGNDESWSPTISDDGRFVVFVSFATDLDDSVTVTAGPNVFVHDRDTDRNGVFDEPGGTSVRLLSRNGADSGLSGNGPSGGITLGAQWDRRPLISGDGSTVVFGSSATNLLDPADGVTAFANPNVYTVSSGGGKIRLVSINDAQTASGSAPGGGTASNVSISGDGRRIAFASNFTNLIGDDVEGAQDVFLYNSATGRTIRASEARDGSGGNAASQEPVISRDGNHLVFQSLASNLADGDANSAFDVFVYDARTRRTSLVSRNRDSGAAGSTGNAASGGGAGIDKGAYAISDNGRFIAFTSSATNLLDPATGISDTNGTLDVFWMDRDADGNGIFDEAGPGGTLTKLVSVNADGTASANALAASGGSSAVSISGDGKYVLFSSPGTNLISGGTSGTAVYLRDMFADATTLIGLTGTPAALQSGVRESGIATSPLRVAFSSLNADLDPGASDTNGELDIFFWTAPPDILLTGSRSDGIDTTQVGYRIENQAVSAPFELGVYRSADGAFSGDDLLLGTVTISGSGLLPGNRAVSFTVGTGTGKIPLPGFGVAETGSDYEILFVLDHLDTVSESDADPFDDDNTGSFSGVYHPGSGPLMIHGRTGDDRLVVTEPDAATVEVDFNGVIRMYPAAEVTAVRFRGHAGDDFAQTASTPDLLLGGLGNDELRGGDDSDILAGNLGKDRLFGEGGYDFIYDGGGDDFVDVGADGGEVLATPGSDDIFFASDAIDTLNFSLDDQPNTTALDSTAVQRIDPLNNTIQLTGQWENYTGSRFSDQVSVNALPFARIFDGGLGADILIIDATGTTVSEFGNTITFGNGGSISHSGFETIEILHADVRIIDDSSATGFSHTGFFDSSPLFPQGFNDGVKFSGANSGNTAQWTFSDLPPGQYAVSATWTNAPDRASDAPFTLRDGGSSGTIVSQIDINQEPAPNDFNDLGFGWENLGIVDVTGSQLTVQLTDNADEFVVADAIRIEPLQKLQVEYRDPSTDLWNPLNHNDTLDLGTIARANTTGDAATTALLRIVNTGPGYFGGLFEDVIVSGTGFTLRTPPETRFIPPGGLTELEVEFNGNSTGGFDGSVVVSSNNPLVANVVVLPHVNVVDDSTPPTIEIVSPGNSPVFLESTTLPIVAAVTDDVQIRRVEFLIDGDVIVAEQAPWEVEYQFAAGEVPPAELAVQVTAFDTAGNMATDNVDLVIIPATPPTVQIVVPDGVDPFVEPITLDLLPRDSELSDIRITRIDVFANTTHILQLPPDALQMTLPVLNSAGPVIISVIVTDQFGREFAYPLRTFTPTAPLSFISPLSRFVQIRATTLDHVFQPIAEGGLGQAAFGSGSPDVADVIEFTRTLDQNFAPATAVLSYELFIRHLETGNSQHIPGLTSNTYEAMLPLPGTYRMWLRTEDTNHVLSDWTDPYDFYKGNPAPPDTVVTRVTTAVQDATPEVSIQLVQLSLMSAEPITLPIGDAEGMTYEVFVRDLTAPVGPDLWLKNLNSTPLEIPQGLLNGDYRIWSRAVNTSLQPGPWSAPTDITINVPIPDAPVLHAPMGTVNDSHPMINWDGVLYADTYDVLIRRMDRGQPDLLQNVDEMLGFAPTMALQDGDYRVWVRGRTSAGVPGLWSAPSDFSVFVATPGQVTGFLRSGVGNPPAFNWDEEINAESYEVWVRNLGTGANPAYHANDVTGTAYSFTADFDEGDYRAWTRAINSQNEAGPWSDPVDFSI
ncbi:MAG: hypothetical protein KDA85_00590 [Planctomycetaceae bacterium]|nr:hypothetical protein [Planctomycetaceae bacterium]